MCFDTHTKENNCKYGEEGSPWLKLSFIPCGELKKPSAKNLGRHSACCSVLKATPKGPRPKQGLLNRQKGFIKQQQITNFPPAVSKSSTSPAAPQDTKGERCASPSAKPVLQNNPTTLGKAAAAKAEANTAEASAQHLERRASASRHPNDYFE